MENENKELDTLLLVDDDEIFRKRLLLAMERKGYDVVGFASVKESLAYIKNRPPQFAVVDLRLDDGNGLQVVSELSSATVMVVEAGKLVKEAPEPLNVVAVKIPVTVTPPLVVSNFLNPAL